MSKQPLIIAIAFLGISFPSYALLAYDAADKGVSEVSQPDAKQQEQERLRRINDLIISPEEKQNLINRTVFIGATPDMVKLALGEPKKIIERAWKEKNTILTYYVYYLPDDKNHPHLMERPTILILQNDKLIKAYKGSVLDVGN